MDHYKPGVVTRDYTAHRRAGKSTGYILQCLSLVTRWLQEKSIHTLRGRVDSWNPKIGYLAETRTHARDILWGELKRGLSCFPGARFNNTTLTTVIPRPLTGDEIQIDLKSHRYHDTLRGIKYRRILADELQKITKTALNESIFSTLADSEGALCLLYTSPSPRDS